MKVSLLLIFFWVLGCGVKGDPLPPERPVELGRGRPTYKKAIEGIQIDRQKYRDDEDEDEEKDGQKDNEDD